LKTQWQWAQRFLAQPSLLGIIDSYGVELIHPIRKGRTANGWVETGVSNHRWIVGGKLCLEVNHLGQIIGWAWSPANAHDSWFHPLIERFKDRFSNLMPSHFFVLTHFSYAKRSQKIRSGSTPASTAI
jgi:hypothetical protein